MWCSTSGNEAFHLYTTDKQRSRLCDNNANISHHNGRSVTIFFIYIEILIKRTNPLENLT